MRVGAAPLLLSLALAAATAAARADAVVQYLASQPLPEGTVAVIDPAVGSSSGTPGSEVRVAVGDVLRFRFEVASLPASALRGLQSYVTVYIPPGAELVGARIVDAAGST